MLPAPPVEPVPGLVASLRFRGDGPRGAAQLVGRLREATALLSTYPGFIDARVGRAIDDGTLVSLDLAWDTVGSYRRALSSYDVKLQVVPLLSQAIDGPTAFETLHLRDRGGAIDATGALAADAGSVSLGSAAAGFVPPAPS
ncbi:MAG: antibiotic biosynthesis monooxygenase [Actinomycetota bacterium]